MEDRAPHSAPLAQIRIAVVGGGRVAQAVHLPLLAADRARFDLRGVADPSPSLRALAEERHGVPARASLGELLELGLDAIVCATPVATHRDVVVAALDAGLHVLCEKPLAFTLEEHDEIAAARERAGRVVQVGYMRRFDPAYRALLDRLADGPADGLRLISAEVIDPTQAPFTAHLDLRAPADLPEDARAEIARFEREQVARGTGRELDPDGAAYRAFRHGYTGSVVHDVNLVHGMLERIDHPIPIAPSDAAYWAGGHAVELAAPLRDGGRVRASYLRHAGVPRYRERLTVVLEERAFDLELESAYLPHRPARLVEHARGARGELVTTELATSYEDAFELQLDAFYAAVADGAPVENTPERARVDLEAIQAAHAIAVQRDGS